MKVMLVYGTRPEGIKMAPLVRALAEHEALTPVVAVTGQHREMLDQVNALFGIRPDFDLDLMKHGASLTDLSARALVAVGKMLEEHRPDTVVVQGDTSSAFIAALAAFYQQIPVVHLEAGLRTGNIRSPFPEEGNRRLVAPLAALHLAPTAGARYNLLAENIPEEDVFVTGNTVIDALRESLATPAELADRQLAGMINDGRQILLVTAHRRESWGEKMVEAMGAIRQLALNRPGLQVVLPMHPNPVVRESIRGALGAVPNVHLTEPLDYHAFCHLMAASHIVLTDSGGVQEEAPSLGKPVLVMRDTTERPEAVHAGTVRLVGTDRDMILQEMDQLLDDPAYYDVFANAVNPYGDGKAGTRCAAAIGELLGVDWRPEAFDPLRQAAV